MKAKALFVSTLLGLGFCSAIAGCGGSTSLSTNQPSPSGSNPAPAITAISVYPKNLVAFDF